MRPVETPRKITLGDHWLAVHESGDGDPALLLHSGGFSSRQWRKLAATLAPTHRVMVPDLLGYGASSQWPTGAAFHFEQDIEPLQMLLDSLSTPAHLVGHSYGGFLALKLALSRPQRVRSLALFEPVAFGILDEPVDDDFRRALDEVQRDYQPGASGADDVWLAQFVDWWNGRGAWDALAEDARANFRAVGWKVFQEVKSLTVDKTDRATYATISAPTLLLGGDGSPMTERRVIEKLTQALPQAKRITFPGVGHMGPITHVSLVNEAIVAHVRAHGAPR